MATDYKDTVFLPKSSFSMRANLPQKEPEILKRWQEQDLYHKMREAREGCEDYILHDGPPYANGHIHIGTGMNKILKDVVNRAQHMSGKRITYVPGWDCHGLPIEWKIEEKYRAEKQNKDDVPVVQFREECRNFADKWLSVQSQEFQRLGVMGDWDNPYITMDYSAEAQIVRELGKFLMNGSLYKGEKPVMWSVVEKTALAEAEVEYHDHTSPSIYVRFPIQQSPHSELQDAFAVIWTTTPWTLPGNRAIAYGEDIVYALIQTSAGEKLLVAEDLAPEIPEIESYKTLKTFKGNELKDTICRHCFFQKGYEFEVPLLPGEHVTTETGTGLVHTAPGHGVEDFEVGKRFNLEVPATVDADGTFYKHVPLFAGQHIFKVNPQVIDTLKEQGMLLHEDKLVHSYPCSWRSKAPLIYRTTPQWFISMEKNDLRAKSLKAIDEVNWFPKRAKKRIEAMIRDRPDWCISRQRAWGTPITIFVNKETGEPLRDSKVHERIVEAIEKEGADAWFTSDPARFLGTEYSADDYEQVQDVVDVWFDSGSTHSFVLENREELNWPAHLYLEGSDQHRGWFQSSLLESCGTRGRAPYENVLTHGFVLDEQGRKMSKSLGNTISPQEVADKMGIEILRLWVVGSDFVQDLRIGNEILKHNQDIYRRLRNTLRYLVGGLQEFDSAQETVPLEQMPELEKWVLHRIYEVDNQMREAIKKYEFQTLFTIVHNFCAVDLSAFYFDIRKDVLYCDHNSDNTRRALRTVFDHLFRCLTTWLTPVLCFTAEEAWLARFGDNAESVHLQTYPQIPAKWCDEALAQKYATVRSIRRSITGALEMARADGTIGSSLQAEIVVYDPDNMVFADIDWSEMAITSGATIKNAAIPGNAQKTEDQLNIGVVITLAKGEKCQRCWKVLEEVGQNQTYSDLCNRCVSVIEQPAPSRANIG